MPKADLIKNITVLIKGGLHMTNKFKEKFVAMPIEKHEAAAWANEESMQPVSNVNIPSEVQVRNAKEYVDTNQK
jgi:hypothetical protein